MLGTVTVVAAVAILMCSFYYILRKNLGPCNWCGAAKGQACAPTCLGGH